MTETEKAYFNAATKLLQLKNPTKNYYVPNNNTREELRNFADALKELEQAGDIVIYGGDIQNTKNWKAMPL